MSFLSLLDVLCSFWARQKEGPSIWQHDCSDRSSTAVKSQNLLLLVCVKYFLLLSLPLFSTQTRIFSITNTNEAMPAASSKGNSPQNKHWGRIFSWSALQSSGQPRICWQGPTGTKTEAPAQPDNPRQKPDFPGEIQAPGWFVMASPNSHCKPQTTKGQRGWSHSWQASTGAVTALTLCRTWQGDSQLVTWLCGLPECLGFTAAPLFFVSWACLLGGRYISGCSCPSGAGGRPAQHCYSLFLLSW